MRTVLTTGANSGIGLATALELARRGFRSIGSVRSEAKAEVVHEAAAEAGVEVETVLLDVADADSCERALDGLRLFGLVNNAGYTNTGAVEDVDDDEARDQLETMVIAPMRLARLALPAMREAGEGRIVNVSSIYGRTSTPLSGWYQASKHALEAVSDALRIEVASARDPRHPRRAGRVQDRHLGRHGAVARRARRVAVRAGLPAIACSSPGWPSRSWASPTGWPR